MNRLACGLALSLVISAIAGSPFLAQEWSFAIDANGNVSNATFKDSNEVTDEVATVKVTASTASVFNDLELWIVIGSTPTTKLSTIDTGATRRYAVARDGVVRGRSGEGRSLDVRFKNNAVKRYRIEAKAAAGGGGSGSGSTLPQQLDYACIPTAESSYDPEQNRSTVVVSPIGNVYARSLSEFDENDKLTVLVVGHPDLVHRLKVRRASAFRQIGVVRIIGDGEFAGGFIRHAEVEPVACDQHTYVVEDFEPGRGVVEISVAANGQDLPLGSFDFPVRALYSGIFSLGGVWSENVDPKFRVVNPGTGPIVSTEQQGDREFFYTLTYTPFIWGKRKETEGDQFDSRHFWRHINPSFGLVLDDLDDNFLAALTLDLPRGFLISYGRHLRKITVLDENSGLAPGSPFPGDPSTLPTAQSWEDDAFWSLTIDLRAMTKLFRSAGSSKGN